MMHGDENTVKLKDQPGDNRNLLEPLTSNLNIERCMVA